MFFYERSFSFSIFFWLRLSQLLRYFCDLSCRLSFFFRSVVEKWWQVERGGSQLLFKLLPALLFSFNVLARQPPNILHNFHFKAKTCRQPVFHPIFPPPKKPITIIATVFRSGSGFGSKSVAWRGGGPLTIVSENRRQISFTMKFKILSIFSQLQLEDGRDCDLWLPSFSVKFIFHSPLQV